MSIKNNAPNKIFFKFKSALSGNFILKLSASVKNSFEIPLNFLEIRPIS